MSFVAASSDNDVEDEDGDTSNDKDWMLNQENDQVLIEFGLWIQ